ncbi:uncharacterized protein V1510DRAFT_414229 [Dipodascopsis tothii]|uniref:uncharacterized protein n=1 Tax=Dipodascopsis tothii TaxID=44089 RepID=UPI0034CF0025
MPIPARSASAFDDDRVLSSSAGMFRPSMLSTPAASGSLRDSTPSSPVVHDYTYLTQGDPNDGRAVVDLLFGGTVTEQTSELSSQPRSAIGPTAIFPEAALSSNLQELISVEDPLSYLLSTKTYTDDVWGEFGPAVTRIKHDADKGDVDAARRELASLVASVKAKL